MKILIDKRFSLFGDRYRIDIGRENRHKAIVRKKWKVRTIRIFKNKELLYSVLAKARGFFNTRYEIDFGNGRSASGVLVEAQHFQVVIDGNYFDFYEHCGYKTSVFRNNVQIAWWDKGSGPMLRLNYYKIVADDDIDVMLMIMFCLLLGRWNDSKAVLDFGMLTNGLKDFNPDWQHRELAPNIVR